MEVAKTTIVENKQQQEEDDDVMLPGYRFHPTDEELVGFYLRRKVEKKPLTIELIKQIDIYKYDPWDLPKVGMGEKEWYFFCKRGRKYKNSARPNRVTASGFWKATGIDKPIYSVSHSHDHCIGLKKSLVYYRGFAGKGTKTDWMMHEFRLPLTGNDHSNHHMNAKNIDQEVEVWTLCRIFKRIPTYKKYIPHHKDTKIINKNDPSIDSSSKTCSLESDNCEQYVSFGDSSINLSERRNMLNQLVDERTQHVFMGQMNMSSYWDQPPLTTSSFWSPNENGDDFFRDGNWDELRLVVELANMDSHSPVVYGCS